MKTNIANGNITLGTVYTHGGKLVIGDKEKGMVLDLPMPEGLYEVKGNTNYYGEVYSVEIGFLNAKFTTDEVVEVSDRCVMYGTNLSKLTPTQQQERLDTQVYKFKAILDSIPMNGLSLMGYSLNYYISKLKSELRLDDAGIIEIAYEIYKSANKLVNAEQQVQQEPQVQKEQILKWKAWFFINLLESKVEKVS